MVTSPGVEGGPVSNGDTMGTNHVDNNNDAKKVRRRDVFLKKKKEKFPHRQYRDLCKCRNEIMLRLFSAEIGRVSTLRNFNFFKKYVIVPTVIWPRQFPNASYTDRNYRSEFLLHCFYW